MQKKLYILVTLLLLQCSPFGGWGAFAQTYPVTISTQLTQPSPIYLSNYANTTSINSPIKVQLILNDLTIMNRQVRLKCYFQGALSFVSNDFVVGAAPIYLEGGFPTQLTNVELGPYFEYQNLQGVNPNQYAQPLPEGIYTLSFEVYDFATNKKLSKKSSVTTIIFQNEPPFLNLPANNAGIVEQNIQNIIFSWTPRSINVSNVEYEFSLVEIWNTNTPLQNSFAYSQPLYTTTTRNTTVQYSITEPQLIPGKTYAWRVKAKALVGAEEIGVFKNNGYSEIFSFKYLTFCKAPLAITTTDVSQDQAKVTWSGEVDNYDYQVNYREKNADSKWYKLVTPREYITISNLKPKTTYEYTVGAACDPGEYTHSSIQEFTTLAQDEIAFAGCGIKPDPAALSNKTPLPALFPNDVVTAGDFPIVVLKSTGSNGTFSGEGYVTLPFLEKFRELIDAADALGGDKVNIGKYSRIRITFNNIGINTDFKLISGEIVASYDKNWGGMVDGDKLVNDIMGDTGTVIPIDVQFEIKSVVKNPDGTLTITGTNGAVNIQPKTANDVIITDRNGNQYAVSPNAPAGEIKSIGKAAPGGVPTPQNTNGMGSGGNIKEISSPDVSITFAAGTGFYSLDENPNQDPKLKANTKLNNTYDIIPKKDGSSYYVHYKVISDAPKAEDYVTAKATFSNGKTTADIVFKTENGTEIPSTWSGNIATLSLKRTLDFAKESILATVKPAETTANTTPPSGAGGPKYDIAGTLNMWHVTGKKVNVTLVGLNGGETPTQSQAQEYLNDIYGKAGIQFEVSTTKVDITDSWGASIETGDSDLLNTYTNGQQTITNDFQTQLGTNYKNDTYYVFFTKVPASKSGILGFMPLKRQFGFVFAPPLGTSGLRTLAHELGHGIFGLQHPFTEYNTTVTTDLLMDYGTGTALNHNDWEIMHAPGLQLYQFTQRDKDGEYETDGHYSTVYLVSLMLGMDQNKALELAIATEAPDTTVHSETKFELNDTWGHPFGPQQEIHSLTGGFHGIEEFFTAIKFLNTSTNDVKQLGELLHRFGDTYAHTKINNLIPDDIKETEDLKNMDPITLQKYMAAWKMEEGASLSYNVKPWIKFFNYYLREYGFDFLENEKHQKLIFQGKTLKDVLKDIYLNNSTTNFIMYGESDYTKDHFESDGGYPDMIYLRTDWYLFYVQNLAWLISEKFKLNNSKLDLETFKKMTRFASINRCSLKGIIDYEIAKIRKQNTIYVPLFYADGRILASIDEAIITNYQKVAIDATQYTTKYLIEQGISPNRIKVTKTDRLIIQNGSPSVGPNATTLSTTTEAFVITIN